MRDQKLHDFVDQALLLTLDLVALFRIHLKPMWGGMVRLPEIFILMEINAGGKGLGRRTAADGRPVQCRRPLPKRRSKRCSSALPGTRPATWYW